MQFCKSKCSSTKIKIPKVGTTSLRVSNCDDIEEKLACYPQISKSSKKRGLGTLYSAVCCIKFFFFAVASIVF